jgi:hypothetical protein
VEPGTAAAERGAHAGAAAGQRSATAPAVGTAGSKGIGFDSLEDFDAVLGRRVAALRERGRWRGIVLGVQVSARCAEVLAWPVGRVCPLGRLREAWVANRYGLAMVCESGTALAGPASAAARGLAARAIALYEAHAEHRPLGGPASGAGAVCVLARQQRAERFAGDLARLLGLAKAMRAVALEHDRQRIQRARARAQRRQTPSNQRFQFRLTVPRSETAELRRRRVRDAVLLAGADPAAWPNAELALRHLPELRGAPDSPTLLGRDRLEELDGNGARATRYRAELARGLWRLPDTFPQLTDQPSQPKEPAPR